MKRYMMTMVAMIAWMGTYAMDYETAREKAYYLTDKMAYELNLNDQQYDDAYEINLDYLMSLNTAEDLADEIYWRNRNYDLQHILHAWQWTTFIATEYLYRPVWWLNGGWHYPIYSYYARDYYFYHRPSIFWEYRGGHGRHYFATGFYVHRRPLWQGGLRGMNRSMVGHPNGPRQPHRPYGHVGGRTHDRRGGGYHFERRGSDHRPGLNHRPGNDHRNNNGFRHDNNHRSDNGVRHDNNRRSDNGFRPGNNHRPSGSVHSESLRSSSRTTVSDSHRSSFSSRGGSMSSRGSSVNSNRGGSSFSGRGGSVSGGRGASGGSSRGGHHGGHR